MGVHRSVEDGRDRASKRVREAAGQLPGEASFERLEPRVLLSVDHPSLMFPLFPSDGTALDVSGDFEDAVGGRINSAGDDDLFRFVMPGGPGQSDFVSVLADTTSTGADDLDTRVEVYDTAGRLIIGPSIEGRTGLNNGELSTGIASDGWAGFVATARQTYFIRVLGENDTVGAYQLRVQTASTQIDVNLTARDIASPTYHLDQPLGNGSATGILGDVNGQSGFAQDDMIFRLRVPSADVLPEDLFRFDSIGSVNVIETVDGDGARIDPVDTHVEVYDAAGNLLVSDIEGGRLTDAFAVFRSRVDTDFFVRVRSDELVQPPRGGDVDDPTRGEFTLIVDQAANNIDVDMRTRLGPADVQDVLFNGTNTDIFSFTSQGTGRSFIDVIGLVVPDRLGPMAPPAFPQGQLQTHLYDSSGTELAFSPFGSISVDLVGGEQYYILVEGFSRDAGYLTTGEGGYGIFLEASHADINVDIPENLGENATPEQLRRFELATPLIFDTANPFPIFDGYGNILQDRGLRIAAEGTGRIYEFNDSDVFQFVAPVDQAGEYEGDNDDAGTGLFVGGSYDFIDPANPYAAFSPNFSVWDANDFWATGAQNPDPDAPLGFFDNVNTPETDGAEIYSLLALEAGQLGEGQPNPILFIGGDFTLFTAAGAIQNLAIYFFDAVSGQYVFAPFGDPNAPVRAMTTFDPDDFTVPQSGEDEDLEFTEPTDLEQLVIGGDFTEWFGAEALRIASFDLVNGPVQLGDGIGTADEDDISSVRALAVFDPEDPGDGRDATEEPPILDEVIDPYDAPASLFIGGNFTQTVQANPGEGPATVDTTGISMWNGNFFGPAALGAFITDANAGGVSGNDAVVNALTVFDAPDPGTGVDPEPVLIVGGSFTSLNGVAANNIAAFGRVASAEAMPADPGTDPELRDYSPRLLVEPLDVGIDGTVNALTQWDPGDLDGFPEDPPVLVIGGEFDFMGVTNVIEWTGFAYANAHVGMGVDGVVHTLLAMQDEQEPIILEQELVQEDREALFIGGELTGGVQLLDVRFDGTAPPAWQYFGLNSGVAGEGAIVFALGAFDDQNPEFDNSGTQWDRNDRPSTRVAITLNPDQDAGFNALLNVYDSTGILVYTNDSIAPPFPDPAGSLDPSVLAAVPAPNEAFTFKVYGGEVYYIEVLPNGGGGGRYSLNVITDAVPDIQLGENIPADILETLQQTNRVGPGSGIRPDVNATVTEQVEEREFVLGQFSQANTTGGGDFSTFGDISDWPEGQTFGSWQNRAYQQTPTLNTRVEFNDQAALHGLFDTDFYQIITPGTPGGQKVTVEIRLATQFVDSYLEIITDGEGEETRQGDQKVVRSPLDAAIRIYRADEEQIAFVDENPGVGGYSDVTFAGAVDSDLFGDEAPGFQPTFNEYFLRDPRVVFEADPGVNYYIQVESGQLRNVDFSDPDEPDTSKVDWRRVAGGYQLFVNTISTFDPDGDDDHVDREGNVDFIQPGFLSTSIPTDLSLNSPTSGSGAAVGVINNTVSNEVDSDLFNYTSSHTGRVRFTLELEDGSTLAPQLTIFDEGGAQISTVVGQAGQTIETTVLAERGNRFFPRVSGIARTEGAYRIVVEPVDNAGNVISAYVDDHADASTFSQATPIDIERLGGLGTGDGTIEEAGDADVFVFTATNYEVVTVDIESLTPQLNTAVLIYEVGTDGGRVNIGQTSDIDNPLFLLLAEDFDQNSNDSTVQFSTTVGLDYYIVVQGFDPNVGTGDYRVSINVDAADDHPNLAFFPTATLVDVPFNQATGIGLGGVGGIIEIPSDDDLFAFVAPNTGDAVLELQTTDGLSAVFSIIDSETGEIALREDGTEITAATVNGTASLSLSSDQFIGGETHYFLVDGGPISTEQPNDTGAYEVGITTAPADDHADFGEFGAATPIALDPFTAIGTAAGLISPPADADVDTDLFTFNALADGRIDILVETNSSDLSPAVRILDNTFTEIASDDGDSRAAAVSFQAVGGQAYFILVEANNAQGTAFGTFTVNVDGQSALDDHANTGQFDQATPIVLSNRTADANANGVINFDGDTDLLTFTTLSDGPARIQVVTPNGSTLDVGARVFDSGFNQVAADVAGLPGINASLEFEADAGSQYYVLVESANGELGDYTIRLDTDPPTHFLYYPEGFSSANIDEFIPMVNPNDFDVSYTVVVRYEVGERDQILSTGTLAANSRGGITISSRFDENASAIRKDTPYAIEIQTNGQIGATLSHYDFGVTTGENFTADLSTTWTFASANRDAEKSRDFVVFYNPNAEDINVNFTVVYEDGTMDTFSRTVGAFRRSGINFTTDDAFTKDGKFGLLIEADAPIVSALTSFDIENGRGFGLLGNTDGGAMLGAIPAVTTGDGVESGFSILNTNDTQAEVTIRASYARVDLPDVVRTVMIDPMTTETLMLEDLGFFAGEIAGVSYEASMPVTLSAFEFQFGDGDSTPAAVVAGTEFVFGDAFVNPNFAGITYIENLAVYNPADIASDLTLTFLFTDGTTATSNVTVDAQDFAYISIDQQPAILNRITPTAFSIQVNASSPVVTSFSHYDLFLNGGWSALGAPIGLTNSLTSF